MKFFAGVYLRLIYKKSALSYGRCGTCAAMVDVNGRCAMFNCRDEPPTFGLILKINAEAIFCKLKGSHVSFATMNPKLTRQEGGMKVARDALEIVFIEKELPTYQR
jgi:hypothetical protein